VRLGRRLDRREGRAVALPRRARETRELKVTILLVVGYGRVLLLKNGSSMIADNLKASILLLYMY
jgi:hypothetical protein